MDNTVQTAKTHPLRIPISLLMREICLFAIPIGLMRDSFLVAPSDPRPALIAVPMILAVRAVIEGFSRFFLVPVLLEPWRESRLRATITPPPEREPIRPLDRD